MLPSINESERQKLLTAAGSLRKIYGLDNATLNKLIGSSQTKLAEADLKDTNSGRTVIPLIVPLRFDDEDGDAADLRPITYR